MINRLNKKAYNDLNTNSHNNLYHNCDSPKDNPLTKADRRGKDELGSVIKLQNICLTYSGKSGNITALEDINLTVKKGEFICVLGPSGCGKTTLLNIIAGFLPPTHGEALMGDEPIIGPHWQRCVIFQNPTLYPWLTIRENVAFGLRMRRIAKDKTEDLTDRYIGLTGLRGFESNRPYELSGGMKQRACLARALVNNPSMLLMDEPFGSLDTFTRQNMQALKREIWLETSNTVLLITHDVDEALALATRIVILTERPAKVLGEFQTDFPHLISQKGLEEVRYDSEYVSIRKEILSMLSS